MVFLILLTVSRVHIHSPRFHFLCIYLLCKSTIVRSSSRFYLSISLKISLHTCSAIMLTQRSASFSFGWLWREYIDGWCIVASLMWRFINIGYLRINSVVCWSWRWSEASDVKENTISWTHWSILNWTWFFHCPKYFSLVLQVSLNLTGIFHLWFICNSLTGTHV